MRFWNTLLLSVFALSHLGDDCGGDASSRGGSEGTRPILNDPTGSSGSVDYPAADSGSGFRSLTGSPLCGVMPDSPAGPVTCSPDEVDGDRLSVHCPPDASADAGPPAPACRVEISSGMAAPTCGRAGTGLEGARCSAPADCAAGFECVEAPSGGAGVCRKYCCLNSCADQGFCDFGRTQGSLTTVPVCVHLRSCALLTTGSCDAGETCAVVRDDGAVSCLPVGRAVAGASCELDRCAKDHACLGSVGMRKCVQLCRIGGTDCADGTTCRATSLVQDPRIGICQ